MAEAQAVTGFLKNLQAARKSLSAYPEGHTMQRRSMESLQDSLATLGGGLPVVFELIEGVLHVGQQPVAPGHPMSQELAEQFSARRIRSLTFRPDTSATELGSFLHLMTLSPQEVALAGGYPMIFKERGIESIEPVMASASPAKLAHDLMINGQLLTPDLLSKLENPSLVRALVVKMLQVQSEDAEKGMPSDIPLEVTLKNMDRLVAEQIRKGIPNEKVVDTLLTPEGFQRFKMMHGSSGLEEDLIPSFREVDVVSEKALFLVELMRTSEPRESYRRMVGDFVERVNALVQDEARSSLVSRMLVFMLEERRDEKRREIFNAGMEGLQIADMVDFVFRHLDSKESFQQVILGTMIRSFGQQVSDVVLKRYTEDGEEPSAQAAFEALVHGSRFALASMMATDTGFRMRHAAAMVKLAVACPEGKDYLDECLRGGEQLRERFYWALGKIGQPEVIPWLAHALNESSPLLRKTGLSQLETLECEESVSLLMKFLSDSPKKKIPTDEVCLAINALARLKAQRALPILQNLAERRTWFFDGEGKMLRQYARFAIGKIVS